MRLWFTTSRLSSLLALACIAACAGVAPWRSEPVGVASEAAGSAAPGKSPQPLPGPETLRVGSAYSAGDRSRRGKDYDAGLPHQRVSAQGDNCVFDALGQGHAELAFAIFSYSLPAYVDAPELNLDWQALPGSAPAGGPRYWVALANFETGRWDIFAGPEDGVLPLDLPLDSTSLAPYRRLSDGAVFAAVITVTPGGSLRSLRLGKPGWVHTWVGPAPVEGDNNTMFDLAVDAQGNVYGEMVSTSFDDVADIYSGILKYDSEGRLLWQRFLNGPLYFPDIALDAQGNLFVAVSDIIAHFHLFKLGPDGEVLWQRAFQHPGDPRPWRAWIAVDGDVIHTGFRLQDSWDAPDGCTILRYSSDGTLLMAKDLGVEESTTCQALCAVGGSTYIAGTPSLIKVDAGGGIAWQKWVYDIPGQRAQCCVGLDGNLYVADQDWSLDTPVLVSFDPDGARRWCMEYSSPGGIGTIYALGPAPGGISLTIIEQTASASALLRLDYDGAVLGCDTYALIAGYYTLLGNFTFDSTGRLYATGISYSDGQALNHWSQTICSSGALDPSMVDGSATIADSAGAEVATNLSWSAVAGIEDDITLSGMHTEIGFILRRED